MKILMATMGLDIGGAETHIVELSKELVHQGHQVVIVSNGGVYVPEIAAAGIRHYDAPMHRRSVGNMLRSRSILRDVIRLLWAGLMLAAVWLAVGWALPLLAPFLLGGALACLVEPLVKFLTGAWHMPRRVASALCVLSCAALAGGGAALIVWRLWYELTLLASRLPHLLEELGPLIERVEEWLYRVEVALPTEWKEPARHMPQSRHSSMRSSCR